MRTGSHRRSAWGTAAAALLAGAPAAGQGEITLRQAAILPAGAPVTVADIADLSGPEALPLASRIVDPAGAARRIDCADIRRALEGAGADWSRLILRGAYCRVERAGEGPRPKAADAPDGPALIAPAQGTVGALVGPAIARQLGVPEQDLRLAFEASDAEVLGQSVAGRTVSVHPLGRADRVQCRLTMYEGDRIVGGGLVRVAVLVRADAAVLNAPVRRGEAIGPGRFTRAECWLGPTRCAADPAQLAGQVARVSLEPGAPVLAAQVERPVPVQRGQVVAVHCVSGAILVRLSARALADAREGEVVEVEHLDSSRKDPRRFRGRVRGKGLVVVGGPGSEGQELSQERPSAGEP